MSAEPRVRHSLLIVHPDAALVLSGDGAGDGAAAGAPEAGTDDEPAPWSQLLAAARDLVPDGAWPFGPGRSAAGMRVHVVRARTSAVAPGYRWVDAPDPRWPPGVRAAAAVVLDEVAGRVPADPRRAAWMRREWWARSTEWVDDRLGDVGLARTGDLEPREYWAISAVARVPIADGAAWLKAVPPIFAREPAVLAVLNEAAPGRVPSVIAAAEGADGSRFLMKDAGEVPDDVDESDRPRLAALLAGLQVRTLDAVPRLVAAGCADRSPATLAGELRRMADDGAELDLLNGAERDALRGSVPGLVDRVLALEDGPFPAVLVHGDFHPWNVARPASWSAADAVIIDWTDAAVGPGGVDLATLVPWSEGEEPRARVRDAYAAVWAPHLDAPLAEVRRAVEAAVPAAHVVQALAYDGILRAVEPRTTWSFSGAMAQHLRALIALPAGPA